MKFYFSGAIRGGRERIDIYIKINELLKKYGDILDKHVANPNVDDMEKNYSLEEIYCRDIKWIKECDILIAEVSTPSLGVGYELAYAEKLGKRIICLCDKNVKVSAMIGGNNNFKLINYNNFEDLLVELKNELENID